MAPSNLLTALNAKTAPYLALLSEEEAGNFCPAVLRILKEDSVTLQDMIILDRLEIAPEFRGKGLGLDIMRTCLDQFAGTSRIAAIKPYPLQFEATAKQLVADEWGNRMNLRAMPKGEGKATASLKRYYSKVGFVPVRGTELMIRDLYAELISPE